LNIQAQISLAPYTSWLVGGSADCFAMPTTLFELQECVTWAITHQQSISLLGGGTNVLVSDRGVRGLVICLRKLAGIESELRDGRLVVTAWAGTSKSELLKLFLKHKLAPALFLAGLPGDVGGGVVMNAGVGEALVPREFVELVDWIEVMSLDGTSALRRLSKSQLQWSYRHSSGWQPGVIARVGLSWAMEPIEDLAVRVRDANKVRLSKQPLHLPSCGSVFVNPPGQKAGALIDQSGLRGFAVGGAQVSEKHANFIVNIGEATAQQIHQVIEHVKQVVGARQGVALHTEVVYLGEW
jgi:UDP-N-acetylmuramate dehydrogenase